MAESTGHRVAIVVALIGLIGSLGAALIGNWDRVFGGASRSHGVIATRESPEPPRRADADDEPAVVARERVDPDADSVARAPAATSIAGSWFDPALPDVRSKITQDGARFEFERSGYLPDGSYFESSGDGTLDGGRVESRYRSSYQSGALSSGSCRGTVDAAGRRMDLACEDSVLGSFPVTSVRR